MAKARGVYHRANNKLKSSEEKEERLMLLESWEQFEVSLAEMIFIFVFLTFSLFILTRTLAWYCSPFLWSSFCKLFVGQ